MKACVKTKDTFNSNTQQKEDWLIDVGCLTSSGKYFMIIQDENNVNNMPYACPHLLITPYAMPGKPKKLRRDSLLKMKNKNFITEQYQQLLNFKTRDTSFPLVVELIITMLYFLSVFTGTTHYCSKIGLIVVAFDKEKIVYNCRYSPSRRYCQHKAISK